MHLKLFAMHGIPMVVRRDNGPPFTSSEFELYAAEIGAKADIVGRGSQKSTWTVCHGAGGNGDICSGSGLAICLTSYRQLFSQTFNGLGNKTFSLSSSCLVLTIPLVSFMS